MTPDEKRNERLKLVATALNNVAVAFVVVELVTPVVAGNIPGTPAGLAPLAWLGMGIFLDMLGQRALGDLR